MEGGVVGGVGWSSPSTLVWIVSRILLLWSGWRKVRLTFCVTWESSPYCLQVLGRGVSFTVCVRLGLHKGHVASRLGACPGNWAWEGRGRDHPQGHSSSAVSVIWESVTKENGVIGFCCLWLALGAIGSRVVWGSPCDSMWQLICMAIHGYYWTLTVFDGNYLDDAMKDANIASLICQSVGLATARTNLYTMTLGSLI